ncbi:CD109 antigen-like protein, partial [Dinothrombium tinctorium]
AEEIKNQSKSIYTIIASGKVSPNSIYYVTVHISNALKDTEVTAEVTGLEETTNATVDAKATETVPPNSTKLIAVQIGDFKPGEYKLNVTGRGGADFSRASKLNLDSNNVLAFIQTDKAMYKPGQLVRYRLVVVSQNLIPLPDVEVTTLVKDKNKNILSKFLERSPRNGVISHELQLSDQPILGDYSIQVLAKNQKFEKQFTVAEYVLPTFDVNIESPTFATVNISKFPVAVKAVYTYGKPVKGDLILSISDEQYSYWVRSDRRLVEYQTEINGERLIEVDLKDFVEDNFDGSRMYSFRASVKDKLTGKVYNKTKTFTLYADQFKFELLKSSRRYVKGLPFNLIISVSHRDDTPVANNGPPLKVIYSFGYRDTGKKREKTAIPENGLARIVLDTKPFPSKPKVITALVNGINKTIFASPEEDTSSIKIEVEYSGIKSSLGYVYEVSSSECFTHLQFAEHILNEDNFKVGDKLELELLTKGTVDEFVYHVITKKGIAKSEVIRNSSVDTNMPQIKRNSFNVPLDINSAPRTRVLVHRFCNGSLKAEAVEVDVKGVMRTPVNVSTNVKETKPGLPVEVTVHTSPDSSVGLLGIDQRMLLLKSGNDIEEKDITQGVKRYLGCNGQRDFYSCSPRTDFYDNDLVPWELRQSGFLLFSNHESIRKTITGIAIPISQPVSRPGVAFEDNIEAADMEMDREGDIQANTIKVRQFFPETWIWAMVDADKSGKASFTSNVPDTITSFFISAFALNEETGLGLSDLKTSVKVFRPFFVKLNLPYSVIRGETVAIQVTVYNYMKDAQTAKVTLDNSKQEFDVIVANEGNDIIQEGTAKEKNVDVAPNDGHTLTFLVNPKKVGYIDVMVTVVGNTVGDAIKEKLLVKPEGETHYINKAHLITLEADGKSSRSVDIEMPEQIVADSERVSVSAIGDILGPAINNLGDLLRLPYGCGEQNMIRLVPNVVVLDYLTKARRLSDKVKTKAVANIETGYQRQLTFKHSDGSFSAFGREDSSGSTWLTAFVVKSFIQAKPYVTIDERIINESLSFLLRHQREDGSFVESGRVLSRYMQGESGGRTGSLTAYVLAAILSSPQSKSLYSQNLTKAEEYLVKQLEESNNVYETTIISYALHLYGSKEKDNAFKKVMSLATVTPDYTYLQSNDSKHNYYYYGSASVEMTSYLLMTTVLRGETEKALPMLRYLISKQNANGGFSSTQDTVIGIQALASFASKVSEKEPNLKIKVEANGGEAKEIEINKENAIVLQQVLLDPKTKSVKLDASGVGSAIVQVSSQYNQLKESEKPSFAITHKLEGVENENILRLRVCTKYTAGNESGMAVMEASLPSGYTADLESLHDIKKLDVKKVETKDSNTVVVVYFDKITNEDICLTVKANRDVKLANLKAVPITVYDYYDRSKKATVFYSPKQQSTCDICEGED